MGTETSHGFHPIYIPVCIIFSWYSHHIPHCHMEFPMDIRIIIPITNQKKKPETSCSAKLLAGSLFTMVYLLERHEDRCTAFTESWFGWLAMHWSLVDVHIFLVVALVWFGIDGKMVHNGSSWCIMIVFFWYWNMGVSQNRGTPLSLDGFYWKILWKKWMIWGYPHLWKPPYVLYWFLKQWRPPRFLGTPSSRNKSTDQSAYLGNSPRLETEHSPNWSDLVEGQSCKKAIWTWVKTH